ncbi:MAG: LD-carboxypeptidase [bacterium]|nr:LD-carboxypeptidase [bacterium]
MNSVKPKKLKPGDTVAIVSPSRGMPSIFPAVYENGLKVLREWGLEIKEYPTARADAKFLRDNPKVRAQDINDAFADKEVAAIFASIGGDDSVRILPYLDKEIIRSHPKILMGYSDTTTLHVFCSMLGLTTFYGPTIMAGFSQMESLPKSFGEHVHTMLFESLERYEYKPYYTYSDGYPDWAGKGNIGKVHPMKEDNGWRWLQGEGSVRGQLFGGCMEVLEMMNGTVYWPATDFWKGKIFFLETSEEKPPLHQVDHVLRNYGMQGVFNGIDGLIFARARDYSDEEKEQLDKKIIEVVAGEFGRNDLSIITNVDIGHTDPQLVLPLGVLLEVNCKKQTLALVEPWLT